MKLNNLIKTNKKKLDQEEVLVLVKEKHLAEVIKVKKQDLVLLLKVLKVVKCLYLEDCQKEVLNHLKKKNIAILNLSNLTKFF